MSRSLCRALILDIDCSETTKKTRLTVNMYGNIQVSSQLFCDTYFISYMPQNI